MESIKLIECPRDAWQGLPGQIPTERKAEYLRGLVAAGFRHIDAVSFVPPKPSWVLVFVSSQSPTRWEQRIRRWFIAWWRRSCANVLNVKWASICIARAQKQ